MGENTRAIVPAQHPRYTPGMIETWDFLQCGAGSAAFNMALDEALLRMAAKRGRSLLRVYSWEKPSVSFGYFQRFPARLADQYQIVRRPTGGGVVYHGDDTTYTVVVPPGRALFTMPTTDAYCLLHKAVAAAFEMQPELHHAELRSPQGQYECFQQPVHGDVVMDGHKLAGGAQRRTGSGMLHQGSIAAKVDPEQLKQGFGEILAVRFKAYHLTEDIELLAKRLALEKYGTDAWNRRILVGSPE
jgi:lipoyl(octanoyl) transferase